MKGKRDIIVLTGAGQIGMAITRRMAYGNRVFVADWKIENMTCYRPHMRLPAGRCAQLEESSFPEYLLSLLYEWVY